MIQSFCLKTRRAEGHLRRRRRRLENNIKMNPIEIN